MIAILLILYNFCANLSNDIYLPSMPQLQQIFSVGPNTLQFTMTTWFLGVALPQLFFGPLTDRIGRRIVLLGGGICFLFATLLCAMASHISLLIIGRFFQGVGICSLNVTTFSILADLYDYQRRTRIMNNISLFGTLAPLVGPVLGGYILVYLGWRYNFLVVFLLASLGILGLYFKLPESNLCLNPQALAFQQIVKNYYRLFKTAGFLRHLIAYCLLLGGLVAYLTGAPFLIISQFKVSPEHFGFTQLPIFGAYVVGAILLGFAKDEEHIKKILKIGLYGTLAGSLGLWMCCLFFGNHLICFIVFITLYAFGLSLCSSPLINEVMSSAAFAKGSGAALLGCGMALSCAFLSMVLSMIYDGQVFSLASLLLINVLLAVTSYTFKTVLPNAILQKN